MWPAALTLPLAERSVHVILRSCAVECVLVYLHLKNVMCHREISRKPGQYEMLGNVSQCYFVAVTSSHYSCVQVCTKRSDLYSEGE